MNEDAIEVMVNVDPIVQEDGTVYFVGETNLPDYANLLFTDRGAEDFMAQTKENVSAGAFETESISNKGEALPNGDYNLSISLSIPSTQSDMFVEVAGENYENLTGKLMKETDLGMMMDYETTFTVEVELEEQFDEVAFEIQSIQPDEVKDLLTYIGIGKDDKLSDVNVVDGRIKACIKIASYGPLPTEDYVVNEYSQISDELLYYEGWDVLTIEFVGVGTNSMHRKEKESNEYGDYFPMIVIEERLK